jgi:hypothetical protein
MEKTFELSFTEQGLREVNIALLERLDSLKNLRKKMVGSGLSPVEADYHIDLIAGTDDEPGLLYRTQTQLDAVYESDNEEIPFG